MAGFRDSTTGFGEHILHCLRLIMGTILTAFWKRRPAKLHSFSGFCGFDKET
jgi:hypothetical protein